MLAEMHGLMGHVMDGKARVNKPFVQALRCPPMQLEFKHAKLEIRKFVALRLKQSSEAVISFLL